MQANEGAVQAYEQTDERVAHCLHPEYWLFQSTVQVDEAFQVVWGLGVPRGGRSPRMLHGAADFSRYLRFDALVSAKCAPQSSMTTEHPTSVAAEAEAETALAAAAVA